MMVRPLCSGVFAALCVLPAAARAQVAPPGPAAPAQGPADAQPILESLPEHLLYIYTREPEAAAPSLAQRQLVASQRRWEKDRVLKVCLFGGNRGVAELIRTVAGEWNRYANVKFDFGPAPGWYNCLAPTQGFFQVRVGFAERGYWSAVGTDAETRLMPLQPSMNLESFNSLYSDMRFAPNTVVANARPYDLAVIRHEFGHALGLLHELQNPALDCSRQVRLSGPGNAYEYLARAPNNWTALQVDRNLGFVGATDPDYEVGEPDPTSVMMYSLPAAIFSPAAASRCAVPVNYAISRKDAQIAAVLYDKQSAGLAGAPGELASSTAKVAAQPTFVDAPNRQDLLTRVRTDLESEDKFTRRDARVRLGDLLQKGTTASEVANLVGQLHSKSYRFQLGVAAALGQARHLVQVSPEVKSELKAAAARTKDLTLKRALEAAQKPPGKRTLTDVVKQGQS